MKPEDLGATVPGAAQSPLYKVLSPNGRAYHGGKGKWPLPNKGKPGKWLTVKGDIKPCVRGLHLCRPKDLLDWLGPEIYEAEARGTIVTAPDKIAVSDARLLRKLPGWNDRTARLFAADCAERALKRERKNNREPNPRSWAAVEAARAFANGEISAAAWAAARDAAWAAAWDAAEDAARAAAWAAARDAARAAAWAAARAAAWAAARDAAWAAPQAAAWAAARDAAWDAERRWQTKRLLEYATGVRA
ncbi:MAG: DUF7666 domain-containing protein [Sulfuricaulis sp.]